MFFFASEQKNSKRENERSVGFITFIAFKRASWVTYLVNTKTTHNFPNWRGDLLELGLVSYNHKIMTYLYGVVFIDFDYCELQVNISSLVLYFSALARPSMTAFLRRGKMLDIKLVYRVAKYLRVHLRWLT